MRTKQPKFFSGKAGILLLAGVIWLGMAGSAYAAMAYEERFDLDAAPPTNWTMDSVVNMVAKGGYAYLTLSGQSWGSATSPMLTMDVSKYSHIQFTVTGVQPASGRGVQFAIQEQGQSEIKLDSGNWHSAPGFFDVSFPGTWSGTKIFQLKIWVESADLLTACTLDSIVITDNVNLVTGWAEEFKTDLAPPTGWSQDMINIVSVSSAGNGDGYGYVTLSGRNWGDALSPDITLNTDNFNNLSLNVTALDAGLGFRTCLLHDGIYTFLDSGYSYTPGVVNFDYVSTVRAGTPAWTGVQTFKVLFFIQGPTIQADTASVDYIRIAGAATPTSTITPTLTSTPTITSTQTSSPTSTNSPTLTCTPTPSITITATPTLTPSDSPTDTPSVTNTPTGTSSQTPTPTPTVSATLTESASMTPTSTQSITFTPTSTITLTGTPTSTSTATQTRTHTPTATPTYTVTLTSSPTPLVTATPTYTVTSTLTNTLTETVTVTETMVVSATTTPTVTLTPILQATASPSNTPLVTFEVESGKVMIYPNPAREHMIFACSADNIASFTVDVYQITGERVVHIAEQKQGSGHQTQSVVWDSKDVAPGIYISHVVVKGAGGQVILDQMKKVAVVK